MVENGEKVLTPKDLLFTDMDIDTRPADIKFESRATPNGELVYTEVCILSLNNGLSSNVTNFKSNLLRDLKG